MRVSVADPCLIARLYQEPRERVIGLVTGLDDMDWSGDPTPVLDHLYMFGPADTDIVE